MMKKLTKEEQDKIAELINHMTLSKGIGTKESACSIAAINLALSGKLNDDIPECMSAVIGSWIISIQDNMPDDLRNSPGWKKLLPSAAGTGREHERERVQLMLDWTWTVVLPSLQQLLANASFFKKQEVLSKWNNALKNQTTGSCNCLNDLIEEINYTDNNIDNYQLLIRLSSAVRLVLSAMRELEQADNPTNVPAWYDTKERYSRNRILSANASIYTVISTCLSLILHYTDHIPDFNPETKETEFWAKIDPAKILAKLIEVSEESK